MTKQWHPTFVQLLRPSVGEHYEVRTNVPVGDAPRLADIVLLRRTSQGPLPFRGLWRHRTPWNALEFKGPTVSPRSEDLDLLVELGLGIYRRLNEEREHEGQPRFAPAEVSFWYLANRLGSRLLREWREHVGDLVECGSGLWRCMVLQRPVFLVRGIDLLVEQDSLPMHLIGKEPLEREREVGEFLLRHPTLWRAFGGFLATLHPNVWEEVEAMAKTKRQRFGFDFEPLIKTMGLKTVIERVGEERVMKELGLERLAQFFESAEDVEQLSPKMRRRLIEKLGGAVEPRADSPPT